MATQPVPNCQSIVVEPKFLSAEPIGTNTIAVTGQGDIDCSKITAQLNGKVGILIIKI